MFDILGYQEATDLPSLFSLLRTCKAPLVIAGGTDIMVKIRERKPGYIERTLIGITSIPELQGITKEADGTIHIGAAMSFDEVENHPLVRAHLPVLAQSAALVGGPQTRHVGTIGGNICNGATSADTAAALFAHEAMLHLVSEHGQRRLPVASFYKGPGKVDLQQGELLASISISPSHYEGWQGGYIKHAVRKAMDIANLGCCVLLKHSGTQIDDLRITFGVAGPTPLRTPNAEAFGKGKAATPEVLEQIGALCLADTTPRDSWRASKEYREQLITHYPARIIEQVLKGEL